MGPECAHELAGELDVPFLDMTPDFEAAARTTFPLYFRYDGHFTPAGHEVAARSLACCASERSSPGAASRLGRLL